MIKRPILTEKSLQEAKEGKFTFEVGIGDSKQTIAREVSRAFKVDVLEVRTRIIKGRRVRIRGTRLKKPASKFKKATVKVASGQKIAVFESTGD